MLGQEDLERVHLLRHTLDVIEAIDTDNELHALESLLEFRYPRLDFGLLEALQNEAIFSGFVPTMRRFVGIAFLAAQDPQFAPRAA